MASNIQAGHCGGSLYAKAKRQTQENRFDILRKKSWRRSVSRSEKAGFTEENDTFGVSGENLSGLSEARIPCFQPLAT